MLDKDEELINEISKIYYNYIKVLLNLMKYSINDNIDQDHIKVKFKFK